MKRKKRKGLSEADMNCPFLAAKYIEARLRWMDTKNKLRSLMFAAEVLGVKLNVQVQMPTL